MALSEQVCQAFAHITSQEPELLRAYALGQNNLFSFCEGMVLQPEQERALVLEWAQNADMQHHFPNPFDYMARREEELRKRDFPNGLYGPSDSFYYDEKFSLHPEKRFKLFQDFLDSCVRENS